MIHASYFARILACLLLVSSLTSVPLRASESSSETSTSWGIPLLTGLAAGALVNYCMSKRTIETEREKAAAIVYAYENHYYIPTVDEINHAYWVLRATDEGLEKSLYWDNVWSTLFGGSLAGGIAFILMNDKGGGHCSWHLCIPYGNSSSRIAAPHYR